MGLTISTDRLIEMFAARFRRREEGIAIYLDTVAADARALVEAWRLAWEAVLQSSNGKVDLEAPTERSEEIRNKLRRAYESLTPMPNAPENARLRTVYRDLTLIIGGRVQEEFQNHFVHHLSGLLWNREITKTTFERLTQSVSGSAVLSDENVTEDVRNFTQVLEVLNREAAELESLARRYRATH
jgi:hypothetical protein